MNIFQSWITVVLQILRKTCLCCCHPLSHFTFLNAIFYWQHFGFQWLVFYSLTLEDRPGYKFAPWEDPGVPHGFLFSFKFFYFEVPAFLCLMSSVVCSSNGYIICYNSHHNCILFAKYTVTFFLNVLTSNALSSKVKTIFTPGQS